jgi:hypothetical protein
MKVAITTNSKDVDDIADEVYDEVVSGLGECGIKDYEWVDVTSVSPDIRK